LELKEDNILYENKELKEDKINVKMEKIKERNFLLKLMLQLILSYKLFDLI